MEEEDSPEAKEAIKKGEELYKFLKNKNYNEIFKVILNTNNFERQMMNNYIEINKSKSIIYIIETELNENGNLKEILAYMFYNPYELDARLLHNAFHSLKKDKKLIIEIFASRPKWYLELIDQEYKRIFKNSLRSEIEKKKKDFNKFLLCLLDTERQVGKHIDIKEAENLVEEMLKKGLKVYGTDLKLFKKVFVEKSREDLIIISRIYFIKTKNTNLYQACTLQVGGDNKELLKALVYCICDPSHYFGHLLKKALFGMKTNTKAINRILAFRSEIDIDVIRNKYKVETGRELIDDIKGTIKGNYGAFLCLLIQKNPSKAQK